MRTVAVTLLGALLTLALSVALTIGACGALIPYSVLCGHNILLGWAVSLVASLIIVPSLWYWLRRRRETTKNAA